MRIKFNLGNVEYNQFTVVIILNLAQRVVGMVVDGVSDVITLTPEQIKRRRNSALRWIPLYHGAGRVEQRMIILMDIERLMTSRDMI